MFLLIIIPSIVLGGIFFYYKKNKMYLAIPIILFIVMLMSILIYKYTITADTEIWSGVITKVRHSEEYDEWHPPVTTTSTDSNGKTTTTTTPGYYEHHSATNVIYTSDNGCEYVNSSMDGKVKFNDNIVNNDKELLKYYPLNTATSSFHTYKNKVQASYSIYKHKEINLKNYPNLHKYPDKRYRNFQINRLFGEFKDKTKISNILNRINSELNRPIRTIDKETNKSVVKAYKQCNLMLIKYTNKDIDYAYAQQDFWNGGNKNDFVITYNVDENNSVTWVYPFSWADSFKSEELKLNVIDLLMNYKNLEDNLDLVLFDIKDLIEEKFERKQFKDFDYIQIELPYSMYITFIIINLIIIAIMIIIYKNE